MHKAEDQLYRAKFRGVSFLFVSSTRSGGRKNVKHEYPNTSRRFVEDLGKVVPTFDIEAVIYGNDDYLTRRDAFIKALEDYGPGELSHPFYGSLKVSVIDYKVTETMKTVGKAEFSIEFAITGEEIYPQQSTTGAPVIALKAEAIVQKVIESGANNYQKTNIAKKSVDKLNFAFLYNKYQHGFNVGMVTYSQTTFNNAVQKILQATNGTEPYMSRVRYSISKFGLDKNKIASSPSLFMTSIQTVFDELESLEDVTQAQLYVGYSSMFKFREEITFPKTNTIQKLANKENNDVISGTINLLALVYAYKQATGIEFVTSDQVLLIRNQLEDQYNYVLTIPNIDYDILNDVKELRTNMREFFNTVESQVFRVTDITTSTIPLPVLVYQYYGELSKLDQINNLNRVVEPSFVEGTVRILAP